MWNPISFSITAEHGVILTERGSLSVFGRLIYWEGNNTYTWFREYCRQIAKSLCNVSGAAASQLKRLTVFSDTGRILAEAE